MMPASLRDSFNLLSKVTFARAINVLLLVVSYYYSRATGKNHHRGMPVSISFEPTTACNLRCPECPSGLRSFTRDTGNLHMNTFKKVIDEIHHKLMYLILYFQGEPYLNGQFFELVSYAKKYNIYTSTSTNAHFLDDERARKTVESGLDRLIISIDGIDQSTYEAYRKGGSLDKVIEGSKNIVKWKKQLKSNSPFVIFQFLVVKPNEHQMGDLKVLAKEIGVDAVGFKTAQIYDYEYGSDLIPDDEKYSRYKKNADGTYAIKNALNNSCWKMWHSCVITWDGKVVPCCFDKDAHHSMGVTSHASFKEIWNNPSYASFRSSLLTSRSSVDMCKNCTEGTEVWT